jgi:hypothetical protein
MEGRHRRPVQGAAAQGQEVASLCTADSAKASTTEGVVTASMIGDADVYGASPIKRRRATKAEMEERAQFLIDYAAEHGPVTVRGLYYQAEVAGVPGIDKTDAGYNKIQRQVLSLRRDHRICYRDIADATRWMRKPTSYDGLHDALAATAALYRRNLWADANTYPEVWCEKGALAGTIYPVTEAFDFAEEVGVEVVFIELAVTLEQIRYLNLPTRTPKRESAADENWPYDFAVELDAISPDYLRRIVNDALEDHLPTHQYRVLKVAEESEREQLWAWANATGGGAT